MILWIESHTCAALLPPPLIHVRRRQVVNCLPRAVPASRFISSSVIQSLVLTSKSSSNPTPELNRQMLRMFIKENLG